MKQNDDERRKLAIQRLKVRAEMRSAHELEDSQVIQQRAEERHAASSAPKSEATPQGPFTWAVQPVVMVIKLVPPPHRVFLACLLVLVLFAGFGKSRGWW